MMIGTGEFSPHEMVVLLAAPVEDLSLLEEDDIVKLSLRVLTRIIPEEEYFLG